MVVPMLSALPALAAVWDLPPVPTGPCPPSCAMGGTDPSLPPWRILPSPQFLDKLPQLGFFHCKCMLSSGTIGVTVC